MDVPSARVEEWLWRKFELAEPTFVAGAPYYRPPPSTWRAKLWRGFDRHPWRTSFLHAVVPTAYLCFQTLNLFRLLAWSPWAAVPVCVGAGLFVLLMLRFVTGPRYYARVGGS